MKNPPLSKQPPPLVQPLLIAKFEELSPPRPFLYKGGLNYANSMFNVHNPLGIKLARNLRIGLSNLRKHLRLT